ncbi:MAG: OmpA family protein [Deltaproteobacteria bacterium]|nr:OmpA family protein [Deltaproteobacteria bacterium]
MVLPRQVGLLFVAGALALFPAVAHADPAQVPDGTVRFQMGSSELTPESQRVLDRLAAMLMRRPELDPIELVGHTDDLGADAANRRLSLGRAQQVRRALISRGIRPGRILVRGVGSAEPLKAEATDEARALNRRVEVWVTPQRAVASVTRVHRKVQAREAADPDWEAARVGQGLRRQAQVRTQQASSSEVTFRSRDRVQLGPEALIVIYEDPATTRRSRADVADVEVEQGTVFAALAARGAVVNGKARALEVGTKPSRVSVRSKRTRVDVKAAPAEAERQVSTVSVFEGRSDVRARGKSVGVVEGFGTRVQEGKAPERPTPLPPAPVWATKDPVLLGAGEALDLTWQRAPEVPVAEVQMGLADDPRVRNPHRLWRVPGDRATGGQAEPGVYFMRLVGVDAKDISGAPGQPLRLVALPEVVDEAGRPALLRQGALRPVGPTILRVPAPPGATFTATGAVDGALVLDARRAGAHRVPFTLTASTSEVRGALELWVPTATLTAERVVTEVRDGKRLATVTFSVVAPAGPLDAPFEAGVVSRATPRLAATPGVPYPLTGCRCRAPAAAAPAEALGGGRYRAVVPLGVTASSTVTVRLYAPGLEAAAELAVVPPPPPLDVRPTPPSRRGGYFAGLRVGALVSHEDAPTAELSLELGRRWALPGSLELDLSAEGGWFPRTVDGQRYHAVPLLGRLALGLDLGAPRVYAGGGGGVRLLSPGSAAGVATAFIGSGYRLGHSEFILEGAYRLMGQAEGSDQELAGWAVILGYRVGTFHVYR